MIRRRLMHTPNSGSQRAGCDGDMVLISLSPSLLAATQFGCGVADDPTCCGGMVPA